MAGIYLHIPFCRQACYYCDFHFSTNTGRKGDLVDAMVNEIRLQSGYLAGEPLRTIYLGGGTPSMLESSELAALFDAIHQTHRVEPGAEVTIEVNPDDINLDSLKTLATLGVNRLSIGIQSFNDHTLRYFNRVHDAAAAKSSFWQAREVGFTNISIDLIYGVPGVGNDGWRSDIEQALQLAPEHISSYSLTIEKDTVFGRWYDKGKIQPAQEQTVAEQLEILMEVLGNAGYEQYEISNFSLPGYHSRHNSSYWFQEKYIGIGPSAHSYNGVSRQFNVRNNYRYMEALKSGLVPMEIETLTRENLINEYILTRLRTRWGCDLTELARRYQWEATTEVKHYLETIVGGKLAEINGSVLTLTDRGKLLADRIASDLFVTSE